MGVDALEAHVIASESLAVTVVPQLGGRLIELTDLRHSRQWLWRNHHVPLQPVVAGSAYDDVWQGGFEELFPNDAPTTLEGVSWPDHGELWSIPWHLEEGSKGSLTLSVTGPTTGVRVTKTLDVTGPQLKVRYRLEHGGDDLLPHLFKLHPAFAIDEACRLDLPGGTVEKVDAEFGNLLNSMETQPWPTEANLAQCRDRFSKTSEFVYVSNLTESWCGITDASTDSWVRIRYSDEVFPFCWIFMTYGGWRDHNVVVLEPCTNYPKDLDSAIAEGTHATLTPGIAKEFDVTFSVGAVGD
jgi:galactose mutarotase-like enzyme